MYTHLTLTDFCFVLRLVRSWKSCKTFRSRKSTPLIWPNLSALSVQSACHKLSCPLLRMCGMCGVAKVVVSVTVKVALWRYKSIGQTTNPAKSGTKQAISLNLAILSRSLTHFHKVLLLIFSTLHKQYGTFIRAILDLCIHI